MNLPRRLALVLAAAAFLATSAALAAGQETQSSYRRGSYSSYGLYSPRGWLFGLGRPQARGAAKRPNMPWERPPSRFERSLPVRMAAFFLHHVPAGDIGPVRLKFKVILE